MEFELEYEGMDDIDQKIASLMADYMGAFWRHTYSTLFKSGKTEINVETRLINGDEILVSLHHLDQTICSRMVLIADPLPLEDLKTAVEKYIKENSLDTIKGNMGIKDLIRYDCNQLEDNIKGALYEDLDNRGFSVSLDDDEDIVVNIIGKELLVIVKTEKLGNISEQKMTLEVEGGIGSDVISLYKNADIEIINYVVEINFEPVLESLRNLIRFYETQNCK